MFEVYGANGIHIRGLDGLRGLVPGIAVPRIAPNASAQRDGVKRHGLETPGGRAWSSLTQGQQVLNFRV